jgi:hypothetical protein
MTASLFRLDHGYDRANADVGTGSRYGNYLAARARTFAEIDYDDPTVEVAVACWRIATGPIMAPPFVVAPPQIIGVTLDRSDWDGEAVLTVEWRTGRPEALHRRQVLPRLAHRLQWTV